MKFKKKLEKLNEENEKEDSLVPKLDRFTVAQNQNFTRATMIYETSKIRNNLCERQSEYFERDEEEIGILNGDSLFINISAYQKYTLGGHSFSIVWVYLIMIGD